MSGKIRNLLILYIIIQFTGCTKPRNNSHRIFRYNESEGITSLDPLQAHNRANIWAICQLYNGLVEPDSNLQLTPSLAERWEVSEDGLIYRFHIRKHVRFHPDNILSDSLELTTQDVEFSLKRVYKNPATRWVLNDIKTDSSGMPEIHSINRYTIEMKLKQPYYQFLNRLAMPYCMIVSKKVIEKLGKGVRTHPIGTGPFKLKTWKENEKLVLLKHDNYFESTERQPIPYIDAINITFVKDRHIELLDFLNGNIDVLNGLDPVIANKLLDKNGLLKEELRSDIRMVKSPYLNTEYLGIYLPDTLETGLTLKIRKKIDASINRNKIIKYLRYNLGNCNIYSIVPENLSRVKKRKIEETPELNREEKIKKITFYSTPGYTEIALQIMNDLERSGLRTEIEINDRSQHKSSVSNGKFGLFRASWIADYGDAESYLSLFYSFNKSPGGPNTTHFSDKEYDHLYELSKKERNGDQRERYYNEMERILRDKLPVIVLYYDEMVRFERNGIEGIRSNALNRLDLRRVLMK
jgi:peptide/nickel transport system substrate-binding protein